MSFDNLCKLLSEKHPVTFASWVLGTPQTNVKVLKTELSIEPIRADYVTFLQLIVKFRVSTSKIHTSIQQRRLAIDNLTVKHAHFRYNHK
jgi:hypothetical protein